jgi:hypothetical protein
MKRSVWIILAFALAMPAVANAMSRSFGVEHRHLLRKFKGKLNFGDTTVEYVPEKDEPRRLWRYEDIQQLALTPGRISILTYQRKKIELGADEAFHYRILSGTVDDLFRKEMENRLARPLVSAILPELIPSRFSIPVRHRKFLSSSQGVLEFGEDLIVFRSTQAADSRLWRYDDLLSVGSTGPFQLRLGALQKTGGEFGEEKNYLFDLKRRLRPEEYDFIWGKINRNAF